MDSPPYHHGDVYLSGRYCGQFREHRITMTTFPYSLEQLGVEAKRVRTNGIELNVFEAGSGPLIVLLHGFPECWASWGPQISFLAENGYRVIVPEQRGYGESDAPPNVEAYDTVELAADVAGLIDAYDEGPAVVIGHDWGCVVAWHTAWLYPEKLAGVGGLSVPWLGRGEISVLQLIETFFADKYFYIRDFQREEFTEYLNRDIPESLTRMLSGTMNQMHQPADDRPFLERIDMPERLLEFMPQALIDLAVSRFRFHGFGPPLNWYRNYQRTFERTAGTPDDVIKVPALYLSGTDEWTVEFAQLLGLDETEKFSDLRVAANKEGGHWIGQEHPAWANEKMGEFLRSIDY